MKRQTFRLGSVLRYYEVQKSRSEYELHQATRVLKDLDAEIVRLGEEMTALAAGLRRNIAGLSTAGWIASYRKSEYLATRLVVVQSLRREQAKVVARLDEQRKRWAIAEETMLSLKSNAAASNQAEAAKAVQLQLDETVLRQWGGAGADEHLDS